MVCSVKLQYKGVIWKKHEHEIRTGVLQGFWNKVGHQNLLYKPNSVCGLWKLDLNLLVVCKE